MRVTSKHRVIIFHISGFAVRRVQVAQAIGQREGLSGVGGRQDKEGLL